MRRTLRLFLCHCLAAGLALPLTAAAQETRGKISGTVRDNAGVIPGASVKITNTETSVSQQFTTNDSGYFEASFLIPGTYAVSAVLPGFQTQSFTDVRIGNAAQVRLNFTLQVANRLLVTVAAGLQAEVHENPMAAPQGIVQLLHPKPGRTLDL